MFTRDIETELPKEDEVEITTDSVVTEDTPPERKRRGHRWSQMEGVPSDFQLYNYLHPGVAIEIHYRNYTWNELDMLNDDTITEADKVSVMLDGISCTGFDVTGLTLGDFKAISLFRKAKTFNANEVTLNFVMDGKPQTHNMRMNEFQFDSLPDHEFPYTYSDDDGIDYEFLPLTMKGYVDLLKKGLATNDVACLAASISNHSFEDSIAFIDNPQGDDMHYINQINEMLFHGFEPIKIPIMHKVHNTFWDDKDDNAKTPEMLAIMPLEINEVSHHEFLEVREDFLLILPFRDAEQSTESRIRFGKGGD